MYFGTRERNLEDVIYFFKEYQQDLNHLSLFIRIKVNMAWPLCLKNELMESLSSITSLLIAQDNFPSPSGIDESFSHLVNLQHLKIMIDNPDWRLPKHIAQQLKSFTIDMRTHKVTQGFLSDMINLKHISLNRASNHQVMTFMSQNMPKLEFMSISMDGPIFGRGFNPKALPNLKRNINQYG